MSDSIERVLILPSPRLTAWAKSFATPEALASWFPDRIEGEFAIGGSFVMIWGEHRCEARLVEYVEGEVFSYQWHPGETCRLADHPEAELTTVRFTLQDHEAGTRVEMVESGFDNIPAERRANALRENTEGWTSELAKLEQAYMK
jgi:uncharacterized protein YndB with AHSA1/START domain